MGATPRFIRGCEAHGERTPLSDERIDPVVDGHGRGDGGLADGFPALEHRGGMSQSQSLVRGESGEAENGARHAAVFGGVVYAGGRDWADGATGAAGHVPAVRRVSEVSVVCRMHAEVTGEGEDRVKTFIVEEPVFRTATLFVLGCRFEVLAAKMKAKYHVEVGEFCGQCGQMFTYTEGEPWRCVWTDRLDLPVVLHEVFHLVTRICEDKGVPIKAHNEQGDSMDETGAYLFEFFARAVMKRQRAWKPGIGPGHDRPRA
jgi:hypothetical protein